MTLGALEIKKVRKYLGNSVSEAGTTYPLAKPVQAPLTGKALIDRLKGLISKAEANRLDRHINESCEQVDD